MNTTILERKENRKFLEELKTKNVRYAKSFQDVKEALEGKRKFALKGRLGEIEIGMVQMISEDFGLKFGTN